MTELSVEPIGELIAKYEDRKAQLADMCLLHLAEREGIDTVFTLDRRDLLVYRVKGNRRLKLLRSV